MSGMPGPKCAYEGKHGYLMYGFFRAGSRKPSVLVCDKHCHTDDGYFQGLLAKIKWDRLNTAPRKPRTSKPRDVSSQMPKWLAS